MIYKVVDDERIENIPRAALIPPNTEIDRRRNSQPLPQSAKQLSLSFKFHGWLPADAYTDNDQPPPVGKLTSSRFGILAICELDKHWKKD